MPALVACSSRVHMQAIYFFVKYHFQDMGMSAYKKLGFVQGKLLSILRLTKALFTFEGGLDYIAWKLERHSGQPIEIPPRVRRWPLVFVWGFMWKLYRRGVFR